MNEDAMKKLAELVKDVEDRKIKMDEIPRMFYIGHKTLGVFAYPSREAKWECVKCSHQWVGEDGLVCPSCEAKCEDYQKYVERDK